MEREVVYINKVLDALFIDLSRYFDCICLDLLVAKVSCSWTPQGNKRYDFYIEPFST